MTPHIIAALAALYTTKLRAHGVTPQRIDLDRSFGDASRNECLAHALYLAEQLPTFVYDEEKCGKANRHLAAIQMCLSFAGCYTLRELMLHNKPLT